MAVSKNKSNQSDETPICDTMERLGKFQRIQYVFSFLATLLVTITHINYVFVAGELNYRCRVPECDELNNVYSPIWWPNNTIDKCLKPILRTNVGPTCNNNSFTDDYEDCTEWVYESNDTVIADLNLGCQPWKVNMIGTTHSIGLLLAMIVSGWLMDRFGRKPMFIFCLVGSCIGHLKALTTNYYIYVLIELIEAVITGGAYTAVSVLMMEIGGKKTRLLAGVIYAFGIYMGESVFAVMAMFVPYWKSLLKVIYTPPIFILSYVYLLKESPRWQIVNGKTDLAKVTLLLISETNNVNINKDELLSMSGEDLKKEFKIENCQQKETFRDAMKSKEIIKRLVIGSFARFAACFVYYGLMINSVSLPGNKYTNFFLSSVMSYPGDIMALYLMNNVGRKLTLVYGYIICGLLCIASVCFPDDYTWVNTAFFLVSKMVVSGCFIGIVTYTIELYPTSVRGTLIGISALTASIGNILAPLTPIMKTFSPILTSLTFGGLAIVAGLLLTMTPETKDSALVDTVEQVDREINLQESNKKQKIKGQINESFVSNEEV